MLALKVAIATAIPDVPSWVAKEMAKIEYKRREIEKERSISVDSADASVQTDSCYISPGVFSGSEANADASNARYYYSSYYGSFGRPPRLIRRQRDGLL